MEKHHAPESGRASAGDSLDSSGNVDTRSNLPGAGQPESGRL